MFRLKLLWPLLLHVSIMLILKYHITQGVGRDDAIATREDHEAHFCRFQDFRKNRRVV
ncbi:MAG: hypothetical protein R3F44_03600 [Candidatus Competibacteraceae bacterium]